MKIGKLELRVPVMNAACSIAKSPEDVRAWCKTKTGSVVVGSITVEPRAGNAQPVWFENEAYSLNSFGMPNRGIEYYRAQLPDMIEQAHGAGKALIVSIAGFSTGEYRQLARMATGAGVDAIELNLGCPNVGHNGTQKPIASFDLEWLGDIISTVGEVTDVPLLLKLSPYSNPAELAKTARAIAKMNAVSAVVSANTFPNGFMLTNGKSVLESNFGGVSGQAILPIALGQVKQFRASLPARIAIIGVGGIESPVDIERYKAAGADAVQIATFAVKNGHSAIDKVISP